MHVGECEGVVVGDRVGVGVNVLEADGVNGKGVVVGVSVFVGVVVL